VTVLRIVVFIQCDICNDLLTEIASTADPRESDAETQDSPLDALMHNLRLVAEQHGWQAIDDSTVHYCTGCWRR
jgi:hypothetical protein